MKTGERKGRRRGNAKTNKLTLAIQGLLPNGISQPQQMDSQPEAARRRVERRCYRGSMGREVAGMYQWTSRVIECINDLVICSDFLRNEELETPI